MNGGVVEWWSNANLNSFRVPGKDAGRTVRQASLLVGTSDKLTNLPLTINTKRSPIYHSPITTLPKLLQDPGNGGAEIAEKVVDIFQKVDSFIPFTGAGGQ